MFLLCFGLLLMIAVLVSQRADRTILSTSVIFLAAGFLIGNGGLKLVSVTAGRSVIETFAELALFAILFTDGARLPVREVIAASNLPGRALLVGMPLTIGGLALAAHFILKVTWIDALLLGAILSPTDPVFVESILRRQVVPLRLRRLLSVESGMNDGLALPLVMVLFVVANHGQVHALRTILDAVLGVPLGVAVAMAFLWLENLPFLGPTSQYAPLAGVAIGLVLLGLAHLTGVNEFLAAFSGGITLVTMCPKLAQEFLRLGAPLAEAIKLATLLVFGSLLTTQFLMASGIAGLFFAVVAILMARPLAILLAFINGGLSTKEWLAAAWFGPKGFASLLYALLMLQAALPHARYLFQVVALTISISIIAHSSTDVAVAKIFREEEAKHPSGAVPPAS